MNYYLISYQTHFGPMVKQAEYVLVKAENPELAVKKLIAKKPDIFVRSINVKETIE